MYCNQSLEKCIRQLLLMLRSYLNVLFPKHRSLHFYFTKIKVSKYFKWNWKYSHTSLLKTKHEFIDSTWDSYFKIIVSSLNPPLLPDALAFEHFAQLIKNVILYLQYFETRLFQNWASASYVNKVFLNRFWHVWLLSPNLLSCLGAQPSELKHTCFFNINSINFPFFHCLTKMSCITFSLTKILVLFYLLSYKTKMNFE